MMFASPYIISEKREYLLCFRKHYGIEKMHRNVIYNRRNDRGFFIARKGTNLTNELGSVYTSVSVHSDDQIIGI